MFFFFFFFARFTVYYACCISCYCYHAKLYINVCVVLRAIAGLTRESKNAFTRGRTDQLNFKQRTKQTTANTRSTINHTLIYRMAPKVVHFFHAPYLWNRSRRNEKDFTEMFPEFLGIKTRFRNVQLFGPPCTYAIIMFIHGESCDLLVMQEKNNLLRAKFGINFPEYHLKQCKKACMLGQ